MQIIKFQNKENQLDEIADYLKAGKVVACPSETSYGLSADAANWPAVKRIYKIKGRQINKSVLMVASSLVMAEKYVKFNVLAKKLAKKYWPGALTLVLPATKAGLKLKGVISPEKTIAIRLSSSQLLRVLSQKLKRPLVSTSANLSGQKDIYSSEELVRIYQKRKYQPDLLIDSGRLKKVKPSTVARVVGNCVEILRPGPVVIKICKA